jgi:hypothetical protein
VICLGRVLGFIVLSYNGVEPVSAAFGSAKCEFALSLEPI